MPVRSKDRTQAFINNHFFIRVTEVEKGSTTLIGAGQYSKWVGPEIRNDHFSKMMVSRKQITTFRIRGRLEIKFVSR